MSPLRPNTPRLRFGWRFWAIAAAYVVLAAGVWGTVIYVAHHFIAKYW